MLLRMGVQTTPKMATRMDIEISRIWSRNDRGSILVGSQERKLGGADEVLERHTGTQVDLLAEVVRVS